MTHPRVCHYNIRRSKMGHIIDKTPWQNAIHALSYSKWADRVLALKVATVERVVDTSFTNIGSPVMSTETPSFQEHSWNGIH